MKRILQSLAVVVSLSIMGTVQTWAEFTLSSDGATLAAESYPRRMVMEEATATWCGWCPQGIVAIDGLKRDFPDNFLAIAIHGNGDKMAYVDEYGLQVDGYPSAFLNRQSTSVGYSWLKRQIEQAGLTTDKMVRIDSVAYVEADEAYKVYTTTRVANSLENAQLRLVYVVTEDSVGPYKQTNNFAGESDEMGGFENLPIKVEMLYSDVARFIYPSCNGLEGSVPSTLEACKDYAYVANVSANFNCDDYGKLQLTVMLYDAATNTIVNADRVALPKRVDVDKMLTIDMGEEPGTLREKIGKDLYKVRSLIIRGKINGDDFGTLRDMMGEVNDSQSNARLENLDLYDAKIVKGGEYYSLFGEKYKLEEDDEIPSSVFYCVKSLQSIKTPSSLKSIDSFAFAQTGNLHEVVLNEGLQEIGGCAFWGDMFGTTIRKINIPSTVRYIGAGILSYCSGLEDFSVHPENPYFMYDGNAVYTKDQSELVMLMPTYEGDIMLPDACTIIRDDACSAVYKLKSLTGKYVTEIGNSAFVNDKALDYIAFGSGLNRILEKPFYGIKVSKMYFGCHEIPGGWYEFDVRPEAWAGYSETTLYVPRDAVDKFKAHSVWGKAKNILPIEDTGFAYLADTELDAVDKVETSSTAMPHSIYSPTGVKLNRPIKGLNIVDGKKVMVK
mgnify:CR=1 FL=1